MRRSRSIGVWRWNRLLRAQHIEVERRKLTESIWVSMFFNNFLPSNIGGDVVRIADTAPAAGSKTLATTVVLVDRALGLTALLIVAAVRRVRRVAHWRSTSRARAGCGWRRRSALARSDFCNRDAGFRGSPAARRCGR